MILTCPECSAKYMVASDSIGEAGRDVRCSKCGHVWHQKSEKDSLDDLINRIQSESFDEDEIDFGESRDPKYPKGSAPTRRPARDVLRPLLVRIRAALGSLFSILGQKTKSLPLKGKIPFLARVKLEKSESFNKGLRGSLAGVGAFLLVGGVLALLHTPLTHVYPPLNTVYKVFGIEEGGPSAQAKITNDMLAFDHLALEPDEGESAHLSGTLINLTSSEIEVPEVRIDIFGEKGKVIWTDKVKLVTAPLSGENQSDFRVKLEKIPSSGARRLELRFDTDPDTHSSEEREG